MNKRYFFSDWSQETIGEEQYATAYICYATRKQVYSVDTVYQNIVTGEVTTRTGKALTEYGLVL